MKKLEMGALSILLAVAIGGCAGRSETQRDDETQSYSTKVSIVGRTEAMLQQGREALMRGDYETAAARFTAVADKQDADPEQRQAALLALGQTYSNGLNPRRDVDRAIAAYRRLIDEHPTSKLRVQAEEALRALDSGR